MALPENNLLVRLHKWAHRQDENFITEAFAHLLQHLLAEEPEAAIRILEAITGGFFRLTIQEARSVNIRTQIILSEGTPDLEIRTSTQLAFLECKSESPADPEQLVRYRRLLAKSGMTSTALILLTRYAVILPQGTKAPDKFVRWYNVAEWLEQESTRYQFKPVSRYLVDQFLGFLGARNMSMGQVTWEMAGGARSLRTLTDMLCEAASACGLQAAPAGSWEYIGAKIGSNLKRPDYYLAIYLDKPEILYFETDYRSVDPECAAQLGLENIEEWPNGKGHSWIKELNLQSEETAFFVRTKARQMQLLEEFLRSCLDTVKRIESPTRDTSPAENGDPDAADESGQSSPGSE
jgi:hypothetical protein